MQKRSRSIDEIKQILNRYSYNQLEKEPGSIDNILRNFELTPDKNIQNNKNNINKNINKNIQLSNGSKQQVLSKIKIKDKDNYKERFVHRIPTVRKLTNIRKISDV